MTPDTYQQLQQLAEASGLAGANQPVSSDDIPRIERPADWAPDWSTKAFALRRRELLISADGIRRWTRDRGRFRSRLITV
jgi:hypothetical protein